jgi:two-component system alkaline phosphatase synthesis response regulator PhoP
MKRRLLVVEDEPGLVVLLTDRLVAAGYEVHVAATGTSALEEALRGAYDLILLDLLLPEKDGLTVCRELRAGGLATPILMLTALGELSDKVVGLRLGADDYLTKPFEAAELLARIEALLRRSDWGGGRSPEPDPFRFGDVEVRFRQVEVLRGGRRVPLSPRMFELLRVLVRHRGEVVSRDQLLDAAWGPNIVVSARTVDVHIAWLRQRLEPDPSSPRHLLTIRGYGYRLAV